MAHTSQKVITPVGTANFVYVFEPREAKEPGQKAKYGLALAWAKDRKDELKPLLDAIAACAVAKWGEGAIAMLKSGKLRNPVRDGDKESEGEEDAPFKGMFFANVTSERQPGIVDDKLQRVISDEDCYSGCEVRVSCGVFAYDKAGNKGVALGLNNVQVVKKGQRIDGRRNAEQDFKDFKSATGAPAGADSDLL